MKHARIKKVLSDGVQLRQRFFTVEEGREDPDTIISGPSSAASERHLNGVSLACR